MRTKKIIAILAAAVLAFSSIIPVKDVYGATYKYFYVTSTPANIRSAPGTSNAVVGKIYSAAYLEYNQKSQKVDGNIWYSIKFTANGKTKDGWMYGPLGKLVEQKASSGKTGIGQAEWAWRAYNEGWRYVWGGSTAGTVDCSGLIRSYMNCWGNALNLIESSPQTGDINSIPRIHGLGVWKSGHCGIYVGKDDDGHDIVIDARNSRVNVRMNEIGYMKWTRWFKIAGADYPTTGWQTYTYNGKANKYYYVNGEFVTGVYTIDGVTYDFGKSGALVRTVSGNTPTTTSAAPKTTAPTVTTTCSTKTTTTTKRTATKATTQTTSHYIAAPLLSAGRVEVTATSLNIREKADKTSRKLGNLAHGKVEDFYEVKVVGSQKWYLIMLDDSYAWICGQLDSSHVYVRVLSVSTTAAPPKTTKASAAATTGKQTTTSSKPTTTTPKTTTTASAPPAPSSDDDDCCAPLPEPMGKLRVKAKPGLNVRTLKDVDSAKLGRLDTGTVVEYWDCAKADGHTWYMIEYKGHFSWICGIWNSSTRYVEIIE